MNRMDINRLKMKCLKWMTECKHLLVPCLLVIGLVFSVVMRNPISAGGGRGWGIGAGIVGTALVAGAIAGSDSGRSYDPYAQLEKEQNRLYKLQDRYARTTSVRKQESLQRRIDFQMNVVQDLQRRLNIAPQSGYQQPAGYQPSAAQPTQAGTSAY